MRTTDRETILIEKIAPPRRSWWLDAAFQKGGPIPPDERERMNRSVVPAGMAGGENRIVGAMHGKV